MLQRVLQRLGLCGVARAPGGLARSSPAVPARPLPPTPLRMRVHGPADVASFLAVGQRCARDIGAALERTGRPLGTFARVLDFGCGCGRTLLAFEGRYPQARWYGTDVDAEAIGWLQAQLPFVAADTNAVLPPLRYGDAMFDLIAG